MKEKCFQLSYNALSDIQLKMSARNKKKKKSSFTDKPELACASMTTSDVNNQWRSNFQQQII
jgi:hypothetical protein